MKRQRDGCRCQNGIITAILSIAIVIMVISIVPSRALADPPFGANVRVDDSGATLTSQLRPVVALNGSGIIYTAWHDNRLGSDDIYFSRSLDGGSSFLTNLRVDDSIGTSTQQQPTIAVNGSGEIYLTWYDLRNGNRDIYFSRSRDEGASFDANVRVDDTGSDSSLQEYPSVANGSNGQVYVAWRDGRGGATNIYFARSVDEGLSFGTNIHVDDAASGAQTWPDVKTDSIGDVFVVWQDNRNGNYDIYFSRTIYATPEFSELMLVFLLGTITTVAIFLRMKRK